MIRIGKEKGIRRRVRLRQAPLYCLKTVIRVVLRLSQERSDTVGELRSERLSTLRSHLGAGSRFSG